jgi:hypothetical protein
MVDPEGTVRVYLVEEGQTIAAVPGAALPSGYVVESVASGEVTLQHPAASHRVVINVPAAPE